MMNRWPSAYRMAKLPAGFKTRLQDFVVTEQLEFEPTGGGEHLFLSIEKCNVSTPEVAQMLARRFAVPGLDVSYAGMKDKKALARQWFSVRGGADDTLVPGEFAPGVRLLELQRHQRKLKRGQIAHNQFAIKLRGSVDDDWTARLEKLASDGAPNYFGPQRFGWDNVERACDWLPHRRSRRISKFKHGLYLSVLRSFLFNEVLAARVAAGNWAEPVVGDATQQGQPTGPLWGRGRSAAQSQAREIEVSALAPHAQVCLGLEHAGLSQQRRSLVSKPQEMSWEKLADDELLVRFALPAGGYATSLLGEVFALETPPNE